MFSKRSINLSRLPIISLALLLVIFSLNSSCKSIANNAPNSYKSSIIMALPPRAYAERQQLSPIRIEGVIQQVTCENNRCNVKMMVESVRRNKTEMELVQGDIITIVDVEDRDSKTDSKPPNQLQAPKIGLPDNSVQIPSPCSRTEAWLRPAGQSGDRNHSKSYQLMAGPYGFGPSLED